MKSFKYQLIVGLLFICNLSNAQESPTDSLQSDLSIIARSYGDSIVLRWAPSSYPVWTLANKNGYVLERWAPGDQEFKKVAGPIFPYSLKEWKAKADTTDMYVTTAAQALHGKQMVDPTESNAMGRKLMAYEEQRGRLAFALLAAEFSTSAADGLGLRYVDRDVKDHKRFLYRVQPLIMIPHRYILMSKRFTSQRP